jgi:diguanylate cyclase (GGDEF)-like protein
VERERLLAENLLSIRHLLSHLQGEVTALESSWSQVLLVLSKLEDACRVDELSGLHRRQAFRDEAEKLYQSNPSVGVMLIDLDHFKKVNDTHGHAAGDQVIRAVGEILGRFQAAGRCVAGRLGGEEFAVALRGDEAELVGTAELIRRLIARVEFHCPKQGVTWSCTASLGVSLWGAGLTLDQILADADERLYRAKDQGRNRVLAA